MIWEGMERIGEMIAAEMSLKNSNRITYSDLEKLLLEDMNEDSDLEIRTEWKTLFQILRIMGLKLEKRNILAQRPDNEINYYKEEFYIDVGF